MHAVRLSGEKPDIPMVAPDNPVAPRNSSKSNPNLTKSCENFTRFCTGYSDPIRKLFPEDQLKMTTGLAGILDLVRKAIFGQERGKPKSDLLVAIQ